MKAEFKPKSESTGVCLSFVKVGYELQEIIQLEIYSLTQKLFHVTAMVFHFIGNLKVKIRHVQETEDAENAWMRELQRSIFGSQFLNLRRCSIQWACFLIRQVYFIVD